LPLAERIDLRVGHDSRGVFEQLQAGELDVALVGSLGPDLLPELTTAAQEGRIDLHVEMGTGVEYLMLCLDPERTPFFLDSRVRQAIAHALDRQRIVDELLAGSTRIAHSFVPPVHPFHLEDLQQDAFDPDLARALLAEAGHPNGFGVSLLVPAGRSDRDKLAEMIAGFLAEIGINVDSQRVEAAKLFAKGQDTPLFGRQFDMALFSWDGGAEPPADLFLSEEVPDESNGWGAMNVSGYRNERFDALALRAMSETDVEQRQALWFQAQQVFAEDLPSIPLFQVAKIAATRPGFQGLALDVSQPSEMRNVERFRR
jgi:peptide/nickel transport system substrate-binding protein